MRHLRIDKDKPWSSPGGDFGEHIRDIRAKEDLKDKGWSKAHPNVRIDFTEFVQKLQHRRQMSDRP